MRKDKNKTRYNNIPNSLRRYRRARGLKQKEVAEMLGLKSSSMISRWKKGFKVNKIDFFAKSGRNKWVFSQDFDSSEMYRKTKSPFFVWEQKGFL